MVLVCFHKGTAQNKTAQVRPAQEAAVATLRRRRFLRLTLTSSSFNTLSTTPAWNGQSKSSFVSVSDFIGEAAESTGVEIGLALLDSAEEKVFDRPLGDPKHFGDFLWGESFELS
jgi:hypothetical protein